jgi:hypothetical protein
LGGIPVIECGDNPHPFAAKGGLDEIQPAVKFFSKKEKLS